MWAGFGQEADPYPSGWLTHRIEWNRRVEKSSPSTKNSSRQEHLPSTVTRRKSKHPWYVVQDACWSTYCHHQPPLTYMKKHSQGSTPQTGDSEPQIWRRESHAEPRRYTSEKSIPSRDPRVGSTSAGSEDQTGSASALE